MEEKRSEGVGFFEGVGVAIRDGIEKRKKAPSSILYDAIVLIVSLIFSRCHIVFGAYPLALSFIATLPSGAWLALIGAVTGSLTLGKMGIIHAIVAVIIVFLRVIIAGGDKNGEKGLFHETLILKIAAATIATFIGSAYEVLLRGFSFSSILYGCASVLLVAVFTFV